MVFTKDSELDLFLQKVFTKINQKRLDKMKQSSIIDFFPKQCTVLIIISVQV